MADLHIRLPAPLLSRLRQHCRDEERQISAVVRRAITEYLDRHHGYNPSVPVEDETVALVPKKRIVVRGHVKPRPPILVDGVKLGSDLR